MAFKLQSGATNWSDGTSFTGGGTSWSWVEHQEVFADNGPFDGLLPGSSASFGAGNPSASPIGTLPDDIAPPATRNLEFNLISTIGRSPFGGTGTNNTPLRVNAVGLGIAQNSGSSDAQFQDNQGWDGEILTFRLEDTSNSNTRFWIKSLGFNGMSTTGIEKALLSSPAFTNLETIFGTNTSENLAGTDSSNTITMTNNTGAESVTIPMADSALTDHDGSGIDGNELDISTTASDDISLSILDDDGDAAFVRNFSLTSISFAVGYEIPNVPDSTSDILICDPETFTLNEDKTYNSLDLDGSDLILQNALIVIDSITINGNIDVTTGLLDANTYILNGGSYKENGVDSILEVDLADTVDGTAIKVLDSGTGNIIDGNIGSGFIVRKS